MRQTENRPHVCANGEPSPCLRLQKYLADAGVASRRKCEELITQGKVSVNNQIVTTLGVKINPTTDIVRLNNQIVKKQNDLVYLLLNKPKGYVTTLKDTHGRPTVLDLLQDVASRVFPVGRLDYETEGLLLMTNDGELAYHLTHPRYKIYKVYEVLVFGNPKESLLQQLREGIELADGLTAPAKIKALTFSEKKSLIQISIYEGRKRQIRRMFEEINHPVLELKRTKLGSLNLDIAPGDYRNLTEDEVIDLKKLIKNAIKGVNHGKKR